jgi:hypothetical protein
MKMSLPLVFLPALLVLLPHQAHAAETPEAVIQLVEAYQGGYLEVVAVSCYQIFSSTGLIANAFADGGLEGPAALDQLSHNSLLHSACYTTLVRIQQLTPIEDSVARAEIQRLAEILELEDTMLRTLADVFSYPDDAAAAKVEKARRAVADALDTYAEGSS